MKSRSILLVSILVLFQKLAACDEQSALNRVYSDDVDESSCLCGLNREILDKIESIVRTSQQNGCSLPSTHSTSSSHPFQIFSNNVDKDKQQPPQQQQQQQQSTDPDSATSNTSGSKPASENLIDKRDPEHDTNSNGNKENGLVDKLTDDIKNLQSQISQLLAANSNSNSNNNNQLDNNNPQQQQQHQQHPKPQSASSSSSFSTSFGLPSGSFQISLPSITTQSNYNNNNNDHKEDSAADSTNARPINSGFLGGIFTSSSNANNEALNKLNQSQKVDTTDMQNALELTVPNVVSNIFSNIQNLTIEAEQNKTSEGPNGDSSSSGVDGATSGGGVLTSIDGSSVSVSGSSAAQITAQGEQLFIQWIDHQLHSLHLTVSMAAYIRRNALSLFRKIVKQYVERVEKMGGRVEDNVRRATQVALSNTQNLISFLLRNYINFAGGLMQIIGEQVSRVGKQLDSTGETIAHINLNPFDIVSNVIDSLPNPSRYSEYFRAFGKYLMGESSSSEQQTSGGNNNDANSDAHHERPKGGLFSKTMGALGKTLGSWIG